MSSIHCQVINCSPDIVVHKIDIIQIPLMCVGFNVYNMGADQIGELCFSCNNCGNGQCELHMLEMFMLQMGVGLFSREDSFLTGLCLSFGYTLRLFLMTFNEINASNFDYNYFPKIRTT